MGKFLGNRRHPIELAISVGWTAYCGILAYKAISERSITLGGRLGISHSEGLAAVVLGLILAGGALVGVGWLLRLHPYRRLLRFLLFVGWFGGSLLYLAFVDI